MLPLLPVVVAEVATALTGAAIGPDPEGDGYGDHGSKAVGAIDVESVRHRSVLAACQTGRKAALGGDIKVPTLGGPDVTLKLPPGTPNGRTLRARGKGAVRKDGTRGDLLVTIEVAVPAATEGKALDALEAYREATADTDPRAELFKAAKGA